MINKVLIAVILMISSTTAYGQSYTHHHHHHSYRSAPQGWVAPFVGGMIVGGVGTALITPRPYVAVPAYVPTCYDQFTGYYDAFGRPIVRRVCQ